MALETGIPSHQLNTGDKKVFCCVARKIRSSLQKCRQRIEHMARSENIRASRHRLQSSVGEHRREGQWALQPPADPAWGS